MTIKIATFKKAVSNHQSAIINQDSACGKMATLEKRRLKQQFFIISNVKINSE